MLLTEEKVIVTWNKIYQKLTCLEEKKNIESGKKIGNIGQIFKI